MNLQALLLTHWDLEIYLETSLQTIKTILVGLAGCESAQLSSGQSFKLYLLPLVVGEREIDIIWGLSWCLRNIVLEGNACSGYMEIRG